MPPATPASILSSPDRRSGRAWGWPVAVANPASAVVVFMLQGCRRRGPPSIRISPGRTLVYLPEVIRIIPDAFGDDPEWPMPSIGLADATGQPARWVVRGGSVP